MGRDFKELSYLKIDRVKYSEGYDRIFKKDNTPLEVLKKIKLDKENMVTKLLKDIKALDIEIDKY